MVLIQGACEANIKPDLDLVMEHCKPVIVNLSIVNEPDLNPM
jgi:hypothetical protein